VLFVEGEFEGWGEGKVLMGFVFRFWWRGVGVLGCWCGFG